MSVNPSSNPIVSDEPAAIGLRGVPLSTLVYCSRAAAEVDDAAVQQIVDNARRANPAWGITGLLVFGGQLFFQWLEGPPASLHWLRERLHTDNRHHGMVVLSQSDDVRERLFPDWSMELVGADSIRDVLQDAMSEPHDDATLATLQAMLDGLAAEGL